MDKVSKRDNHCNVVSIISGRNAGDLAWRSKRARMYIVQGGPRADPCTTLEVTVNDLSPKLCAMDLDLKSPRASDKLSQGEACH